MHFLLIYDVGPDFVSRRAQFRDEHLAQAWRAAESGELLLGGAVAEPTDQAFLLFSGATTDCGLPLCQAPPVVRACS